MYALATFSPPIDAEHLASPEEAAAKALKLVQDKTAEFCSLTDRPPRSLNREFLQSALHELGPGISTV